MKRIIPIAALIAIIFSSCEIEPYSDFSVDYDLVVPGEAVNFSNNSSHASHFEWDFGDGTFSDLRNPTHIYTQEGLYNVKLSAYNGSYVDYSFLTVEVYFTTLEVVVRDYLTDELIPAVNVVIYPTEYDYDDFRNAVFRGKTDYTGGVIIKNLLEQPYYVDVYNNFYNNYTLAKDDIDFIKTRTLKYANHNIFTAYVDYAPIGLKSTDSADLKVRTVKQTTVKRSLKDKLKEKK